MFEKLKQKIKAIDIFNSKRINELETANKNLRQELFNKAADLDWMKEKAEKEVQELKDKEIARKKGTEHYYEMQRKWKECCDRTEQKLEKLRLKLKR